MLLKLISKSLILMLLLSNTSIAHAVTLAEWQKTSFFGCSKNDVIKAIGQPDDSDQKIGLDTYMISDSPDMIMMTMLEYTNDKVSSMFSVFQPSFAYTKIRDMQKTNRELTVISEDPSGILFKFNTPQANGTKFIAVFPSDDKSTGPMLTESINNPFDESSEINAEAPVSLEQNLAAVSRSKSATVELIRDPSSRIPLDKQAFEGLIELLGIENLEAINYPFIFNPEYKVSFDTGVSYSMMQDESDESGEKTQFVILKFAGNEETYKGVYKIFHYSARIKTQLADDFSYMHIYENGKDRENSIEALKRSYTILWAAEDHYKNIGFEVADSNEKESFFRLDSFKIVEMPDVDPKLVYALIEYSVRPKIPETLPSEKAVYAENGWIRGNFFASAIYVDQGKTGCRAYPLGFTPYVPDENGPSPSKIAKEIYEKSQAKTLAR